MQLSRSGTVRAEPNVTPMIDVMLVLLVIFMIIVPAMVAGTPAIPPQGDNLTARPEDPRDQTVAIDRQGQYYLNKRPIAAGALLAALGAVVAGRGEDRVLYVTAHKDLNYEVVHDVVSIAATAGIRLVGLVTERPPRSAATHP